MPAIVSSGAIWRGNLLVGMQLECAFPESLRRDTPTLQLQQESQSRTQEVVQILDRQRYERIGVQGSSGTAAQAGDESLLKQTLPCLVQHAQLTRSSDQVGELVKKAGADAMERADP